MHLSQPTTADVRDMRAGEYSRSSTKRVFYRCTGCGMTHELDSFDYGIAVDGRVLPDFICPDESCATRVALKLKDWTPFDTSDEAQP